MKLLQRLKFILTYDIEPPFILYSIPDQSAMQFLSYDDAKHFSDQQIQYNPKIMVTVKRVS